MGLLEDGKRLAHGRDWRGRAWTPRSAVPWEEPVDRHRPDPAWARSPAAGAVRSVLQRGVLKPTTWAVTAPEVHGAEHLDALSGPAVFVANHASHLDTALILGSLPPAVARRTAVAAAADYFFEGRVRTVLTALVINGFPVERSVRGGGAGVAPQLVRDGWNLLIFPEGTRSTDGWIGPMRRGGAYLCCGLGVPAVPVAVRGTFAAMPRGNAWPVAGRPAVSVRYDRPLWPGDGESSRDFHDRLVTALARLWNEQDVGWYAARRAPAGTALAHAKGPQPAATWRRRWLAGRPLPGTRRPRPWHAPSEPT